ncbi:hypothetical protein D3C85_1046810 [compost metagenome]
MNQAPMTLKQLQDALQKLPNVYQFAVENRVPLRTVMRVRAGGTPTLDTFDKLKIAIAKQPAAKAAAKKARS